jgi:multiple antibiotic resistance protein
MADAEGDLLARGVVLLTLLAVLLLTLGLLLVAVQLQKLLGLTGMNVLTRILGVLLTALAIQFLFDGLAASGLFGEVEPAQPLARFAH